MDDARRRILDEAGLAGDRIEALADFARGRRILHVGCTGHRPGAGDHRTPLDRHERIAAGAAEAVGLDLDRAGVEELQRRGYNALVADACTADLGRTFEVIIAGEIIEHVSNGGLFLDNLRRHLDPDGLLVISTCNPFYTKQVWKILRYGRPAVHGQHAAWYDPITLMELAGRCRLAPRQLIWVREGRRLDPRLWARRLRRYFNSNFILTFTPEPSSTGGRTG